MRLTRTRPPLVNRSTVIGMSEESNSSLPLFSLSNVHLRVWPFVVVLLLAAAGMVPGAFAAQLVNSYLTPAQQAAMPWLAGYASEIGFLIGSLICIGFLGKGRFGEFGLRLPR